LLAFLRLEPRHGVCFPARLRREAARVRSNDA
jgi:hypothetical protein